MLEKTLESPLDYKEIKPDQILKEISPEYSLEGLMLKLKLQYFGHLMQRSDSLEKTLMLGKIEGRRRRRRQRMRWLYDMPDSMDELEQAPGVGDGQGSLVCCSPWGLKELNKTEWLSRTELRMCNYYTKKAIVIQLMKMKHEFQKAQKRRRNKIKAVTKLKDIVCCLWNGHIFYHSNFTTFWAPSITCQDHRHK